MLFFGGGNKLNYFKSYGENIDFKEIPPSFFLIGLINEFNNRFQTAGDEFFSEISWKQCFTLNCIVFFKEPPTIKELSEFIGSSRQNTKQLLKKLEKVDFINMRADAKDKRKQRIILTKKAKDFLKKYDKDSFNFMEFLFSEISEEDTETAIEIITKLDDKLKTARRLKK